MEEKKLPEIIPVFPLSNFIIFPNTNVPLNIFEPRYIQMVDDAMRNNKIIGMVQPKKSGNPDKPDLFEVGCTGKITSYNETDDGRYLIVLNGISRFRILNEVIDKKLYRSVKVDYQEFQNDLNLNKEDIKFSDLELIFVNLKKLFQRQGYSINWKDLEKQSLDQTINTLSMASPFSLEEKQILLESNDINSRRKKLEEILKTYILDNFSNTTVQ
tara:strand:+ start:881 stop:1522 length:642 start_codon:yes stop_codon:yes gene_type:complete